jgi:hypothetical protein
MSPVLIQNELWNSYSLDIRQNYLNGNWPSQGLYINRKRKKKKFWEELMAYFPLIRLRPHRKRCLQQFFVAAGTSLQSCYIAAIRGYTDRPTDKRVQQFFSCCVYSLPQERVYWAVAQQRKKGYTLQSLCPAAIGGIHIQTYRLMWGICEVSVQMGSGAMIYLYIPSSIKIGPGIQKLTGGTHKYTDSMEIA